jgi:hypothetical protein
MMVLLMKYVLVWKDHLSQKANNCIQLTVISVIFFAKAKKPPLITSADAGVRFKRNVLKIYEYVSMNSSYLDLLGQQFNIFKTPIAVVRDS